MFLLFLIFVCVTDFTIVFCSHDLPTEQIHPSKYFPFSNYDSKNLQFRHLRTINHCNADSMKKIHKLIKDDVCSPRLTMVELTDPDPNVVKIVPQNALLQRCMGGPSTKQHGCLPSETKLISIPVVLVITNNLDGKLEQKCGSVTMEEHITCKTGCKITKEDCNSNFKQHFHKDTCRCECTNQNEIKECERAGKMWIEVTCSCECVPSTIVDCSTGFAFDHHSCRCKPISRYHDTNNLRYDLSAMMEKQKK